MQERLAKGIIDLISLFILFFLLFDARVGATSSKS